MSTFLCGPLEVRPGGDDAASLAKLGETFDLYDLDWPGPHRRVEVTVHSTEHDADLVPGRFLTCARMTVDHAPGRLVATTDSGMRAEAVLADDEDRWSVAVPEHVSGEGALVDLEDVASLVLTTGWRREGWVPVHAAAVERHGRCVILTAPSGGGKTTMTSALVRRGWRTLGDDKLLLRIDDDGTPHVAALLHTFNLHPETRSWFPEVGDLEVLPRYSVWTEKRKVPVASVWPDGVTTRGTPGVFVSLDRRDDDGDVEVETLSPADTVAALLRQVVVPGDPDVAGRILEVVSRAASRMRGLHVRVGRGAYRDERSLDALEAAFA